MRLTILTVLSSFIALSNASATSYATEFDKLQNRLLKGQTTFSIVDLRKCKRKDNTPIIPLEAGFRIDSFRIKPGKKPTIIYTRNTLSTMPDGTPTIIFLEYQIAQDDIATITFRRLSPVKYTDLDKPRVSQCKVGVGLKYYP